MKQFFRRALAEAVSRLPRGVLTDKEFFPIYERRGVHITPAHYYYPIPTIEQLDDDIWSKPSQMPGVDMNLQGQEELASTLSGKWFDEYVGLGDAQERASIQYSQRSGFGGCDGAMLYAMIREKRPHQIVEIGSGHSTLLSAAAAARNGKEGQPCSITAIEPNPMPWLADALGDAGKIVQERVEKVPLSLFEQLGPNDILFIDSSHTVRIGGDVVFEINEILPRLRKGVIIHVHDICFPNNYSKQLVIQRKTFWAEQYMLQAFYLAFNGKFRVLWSFSYVKENSPDILERCFPFYSGDDHMGSFWMDRVQ